jgi:single-strand DNA-binding protein
MASLNKVLLIGNLTRDPELRYTQSGSAVCELGMAINRTYMSNNEKKEDVCFVDVNVWGRQAESCSRYLKKGSPLFVEGRLNFDQWNDKETGKTRSKLRVVAERTQFLGSGGRGDDGDQNDSYSGGGNTMNSAPQYGNQPAANNSGSFPPPPPVQPAAPQGGMQVPFSPAPAPAPVQAPIQAPTPAPPAQAPAPTAGQPPAAAPQAAFNPNMGSEDDIPF